MLSLSILVCALSRYAQAAEHPLELYKQLKAFRLSNTTMHVENLVLERDRLKLTLSGDFYFAEPVEGVVYGAVFLGRGQLHTEPWNIAERESIKRFLSQDTVEATFTKAVFRFTDDTFDKIGRQAAAGGAVVAPEAQTLAANLDQHLIRETGMNISSRLLLSIVNQEKPGVFYAEFDGGNRGRFSALLDHQARVPSSVFRIDGGEKGLLFKYQGLQFGNDVWTAFYDAEDFKRASASYSDAFDLVEIPTYRLDVDLRDPGNWLRMEPKMSLVTRADNVQILPMRLNEGLDEVDNERRNKAVHVLSAQLADGTPVGVIQEEWESGFSLILPSVLPRDRSLEITLKLEGKDSLWTWGRDFHFPRSTTSWYPRHGFLSRSTFDITYKHKKNVRIASIGQRVKEGAVDSRGEEWLTQWAMKEPVSLITFVVGRFERHAETADMGGGKQMPIEYYSPPGDIQQVKEDFILAEINNAVRYFSNLFGPYPYGRLGAAYFPTSYGQGFPSLLLLPVEGYALRQEFAFLAHENAHQWWGNIVGWRSYRDQWLSEGFAEYSGVLYTDVRSNRKDSDELVKDMRRTLFAVPKTETGVAKGKLYEVGPLVLGYRLSGTRSANAGSLIYNKGGLVLRMLHYLLSSPDSLNDKGFFDMMKDFVERHRNGLASTEDFMQVAGEHFARSPLGQRYGIKDLNWFFGQWVYQTSVPNYHLDYKIESRDGQLFLRGTLLQENVPDDWFMPLPLIFEFSNNRMARLSVTARGSKTPIEIKLPEKPQKVRLDPDLWILSEKTSEKAN